MNVEKMMKKYVFNFIATRSISNERVSSQSFPQRDVLSRVHPKGCPLKGSLKGMSSQRFLKGVSSQRFLKGMSSRKFPKGQSSRRFPKGMSSRSFSCEHPGDPLFFSFTLFSNCFSTPCLLSKSTVRAMALSLCQSEKVKRIKWKEWVEKRQW